MFKTYNVDNVFYRDVPNERTFFATAWQLKPATCGKNIYTTKTYDLDKYVKGLIIEFEGKKRFLQFHTETPEYYLFERPTNGKQKLKMMVMK